MKINLLLSIIATLISNLSFGQANIIDSIVHQSYQRKFTVHTPTGFTNTTPVSAVLMLHGNGGTMLNSQNFTNLNSVSNTNGFLAVYPEGYGISSGGFSWADGRGTSADIAGIDDLGFINKLLDTLLANYNIDTNKIFICGFSNGGYMTQRFACEQNQRFAAMASLGSIMDTSLYSSCNPQRPIPMMFVIGTADPFVPFNGGTATGAGGVINQIISADTLVSFWIINNNCLQTNSPINLPDIDLTDNSTVTLFNFTNCSCYSDVKFYRINGGGHTWPGVEIPLYEIIAGETNEDIQASEELWNFFNAHTLCNITVGVDEQTILPIIKIYPNPARTELYLSISQTDKSEISVSNLLGQVLIKTQNQNHIDISNLTNGIYMITISKGQTKQTQKFIKE